jgi:hypothetical protein
MKKILIVCSFISVPLFASAATITSMIGAVNGAVSAAFPLALSFAIVYFAWQVIQYTIADGSGKNTGGIVWGLIGITVIVAVMGFVGAIRATLGV